MWKPLLGAGALSAVLASTPVAATIVEMETVLGNIQVNLYDQSTPNTVENFLSYVESGAYDGSFFHRSVPGFILQGGGFMYDEAKEQTVGVDTNDPVTNEPEWSNRKGTIAMAKVGGDANSATSQWFFNLANNHENLDVQNGGFTVFGEIISGMDIVETMAELPRYNVGDFANLPLRNFGEEELENDTPVSPDNLIGVLSITVIDDAENSSADLDPVPNTLIDEVPEDDGDSSGGSVGLMSLLLLAGLGVARRVWPGRRPVRRR